MTTIEEAGTTLEQKMHKLLDAYLMNKINQVAFFNVLKKAKETIIKKSKKSNTSIKKSNSKTTLTKTSKSYDTAYLSAKQFNKYKKLLLAKAKEFGMKYDKQEMTKGSRFGKDYNTYKIYFFSSGIKQAKDFKKSIRLEVWPKIPNPLSRMMR